MTLREHTVEILTGAAVVAVAVGFLIYAMGVSGSGPRAGTYELTASFRSVEGVSVGTDVRLAGVKIGSVTALDLNPETFRADATVAIAEAISVPDDSSILISSEGLLGGSFVEIQPGASPFAMEPGDTFFDTQGAVSLITLLLRFVGGDGQ